MLVAAFGIFLYCGKNVIPDGGEIVFESESVTGEYESVIYYLTHLTSPDMLRGEIVDKERRKGHMKRAVSIMLILLLLISAYMAVSAEQLKKVDSADAIVYPVWNKVLPDRLEVYSAKEDKTYTAGYSFKGYMDNCSIDRGYLFYEKDSLKGGGSGTLEIKDISKDTFQRTEKLDIYDYYITSDSIMVIDYEGISKYDIDSKSYNRLLMNPEHELQLLFADDSTLIYYNSDTLELNVYDYITEEYIGKYMLGELEPANCVMLDNEIYFIDSVDGNLYKIDERSGKAEMQFAVMPQEVDDDITTFIRAVVRDKHIYCNGYDGSIYRISPENRESSIVFDASENMEFEPDGCDVKYTEEHILIHFRSYGGLTSEKKNVVIDY